MDKLTIEEIEAKLANCSAALSIAQNCEAAFLDDVRGVCALVADTIDGVRACLMSEYVKQS